jgi:hypothetical protein
MSDVTHGVWIGSVANIGYQVPKMPEIHKTNDYLHHFCNIVTIP